MAVPDFQTIMRPLLEFAGDGEAHSLQESYVALAHRFDLNQDDLDELLPSGRQTTFTNRVSWASTYLKKAELLSAPKRGYMEITELGMDVLRQGPERINIRFLSQFDSFRDFKVRKSETAAGIAEDTDLSDNTPEETLTSVYAAIRDEIETELLDLVKSVSPARFERIVVDVLVKMGYGGSRIDAGQAIGRSGDEGIDGIINEDKLGLDVVYIQAKRWEGTVSRPEIQKFAGALQGKRARKGVFITTSDFSAQAREFVSNIDNKIILIDGQQLARYMFEYNVGTLVTDTYEIKKTDADYFE
jgi:restriction system protein